jgi:hypothetical protein
MGDYTVVAEAGQALIQAIWSAINVDASLKTLIGNPNLISLESPAEHVGNKDDALLSIYLYRIGEDSYMKNRCPVEGSGGGQRRAPLALDLYYLITPLLTNARDRQIVLGKVMQVFYDHPTLEGTDLTGTSLSADGDVLRIVLDPLPLNEVALVWQALEIPYMLCVSYAVRVALLQSTVQSGGGRIVTVDRRYGQRMPLARGSA